MRRPFARRAVKRFMPGEELEDAMWVTAAEVGAALAGEPDAPFLAPPPYAIAHSLLAAWLAGRS